MTDLKEVSILEDLKNQHTQFITQRDQAQSNLQQLIGAIFGIELAINKLEEKEIKTGTENIEPFD